MRDDKQRERSTLVHSRCQMIIQGPSIKVVHPRKFWFFKTCLFFWHHKKSVKVVRYNAVIVFLWGGGVRVEVRKGAKGDEGKGWRNKKRRMGD